MIVLHVEGTGRVEAEYSLRVGREASWADLVLTEDLVSRHHFEIRADGEGYRVWDMGSRNGTTLDRGAVSRGGRVLHVGAELRAGNSRVVRVVEITPPPATKATVAGPQERTLGVRLDGDQFIVVWALGGQRLRDTMPYQLGLTLSLLVLFQRDELGPVPDADLRALVWRGDKVGLEKGNINRLLHRLREWFRSRTAEVPPIVRPKGTGSTRLDLPAPALAVHPDGWLYRFLDGV